MCSVLFFPSFSFLSPFLSSNMQSSVSYIGMPIEDYPPYKELLMTRVQLHGPAPKRVSTCTCGSYIVDGYCACAYAYKDTPKGIWTREHPEAYMAEQRCERRWDALSKIWAEQQREYDDIWIRISTPVYKEFTSLQDAQSRIGCAECESYGCRYCRCSCEHCGNKWCDGVCKQDDDTESCYCGDHDCDYTCGTLSCGCIDICRGRCGFHSGREW